MKNNILLQYLVRAEGRRAGLERMDMINRHLLQQVFAEGTEIGAIAKAPGRNGHQLPTGIQQTHNQGHERGV